MPCHTSHRESLPRRAVAPSIAALLLSAICIAPAAADTVPAVERFKEGAVEVTVTRFPDRRLDFVVVVPATLDQVWQAFTTSEGLVTWLTPAATVELRIGGAWEADYPGGRTAGGTILSFLPQQMLAIAALAPEAYPTVRRERTQAVFLFEVVDATHTRIRLSQIGWKTGDEWDRAFAFLSKGNAELLNSLQHRFAAGPIDWKAAFGKPAAPSH